MENYRADRPEVQEPPRRTGATSAKPARSPKRRSLGSADGCALERYPRQISVLPDVPPSLSTVGSGRRIGEDTHCACDGLATARAHRRNGGIHRRHIRAGKKRGFGVGKTKRGKGSKIMAIADRTGLPVACNVASATPHETKLVESTLDRMWIKDKPVYLIGDKAYDSDPLDARLLVDRGIVLVAPNRENRVNEYPQDGRLLRRYKRRWKIERLFAWLQNFRRIVTRYEYYIENYHGMVLLGCIIILLRHF